MLLEHLLSDNPIAVETMNDPSCIQSAQQDQKEEIRVLKDRVHHLGSALKVAVCELKRLKQREKVDKEYNARLRKLMDRVVEESNERQKTCMAMRMEFVDEKKTFLAELEKTQHLLKSTESERASLSKDNEILRKHILELTAALRKTRGSNAVSVESTTHLNTQAEIRSTAPSLPRAGGVTQFADFNSTQWQGQSSVAAGVVEMQCIPATSFAPVVNSAPVAAPRVSLIVDSAPSARPESPDVAIISPPPPPPPYPGRHTPAAAMFPVQPGSINPALTMAEEAPGPVNLSHIAPTDFIAPCWEPGGDTAVWWPPIDLDDGPAESGAQSSTSNYAVIDLVDCYSDVSEDENNCQQKSTGNSEANTHLPKRNLTGEVPVNIRPKSTKYVACGKCGKFLSNMSRHTCSFKCQKCEKTFTSKFNLTRHRRTHADPRRFICESCGRTFQCSSSFNEHIKLHTKEHVTDRRLACKKCGKTSTKSNPLVERAKDVHGGTPQQFSIIIPPNVTPSDR